MNLPSKIYSGAYNEGHVQGIAVDTQRGFVYYSFTTMLLKTDLLGNPIGSVIHLAGHLGCITYDETKNRIYGSLELKHDIIGSGIIRRTGWNPTEEDAFYLVSFDCASICRMGMNAERDRIMLAVYLSEVVQDYTQTDEVSGKKHRYGCSGIDGTGLGPVFGAPTDSTKKIMIAYGIYSETDRTDNDHQILLQYDTSVIDQYGQPLCQSTPHHSGPPSCETRYFFYTGNTTFGVQNLEYDPYTGNWLVAVYRGKKEAFENYSMFFIDGKKAPIIQELMGRGGEQGSLLFSASREGSHFPYGSTGAVSLGDGTYYFSQIGKNEHGHFTHLQHYTFSLNHPHLFEEI